MTQPPSRIRNAIEIIGAAAVIASLVFVGIQIRQNSAATRAAATQELGRAWIDWNVATATREIQEALVSVSQFSDPLQAPIVDQRIAESYARSIFSNWSISDYQCQTGVLDTPLCEGVRRDMQSVADSLWFGRLMRWAWLRNRHLYNNHFTAAMDSLTAHGTSR